MLTDRRTIKIIRFIGLFISSTTLFFLWHHIQIYIEIIAPLSENILQAEELNNWHRTALLFFLFPLCAVACHLISMYSHKQDPWEKINTLCPIGLRAIFYGISILAWVDGAYCHVILFSIPARNSYKIWNYWRERSVLDGQIFCYSIFVLVFITLFLVTYQKQAR